ncbi:hypothetical protein WDW89_24370 [Deltaproteobacteria bacterium TL4]
MYSTYHLQADELNEQFLKSLQILFQGQELEIAVQACDDTEHLMRSESNRQHLLQSIAHIESGKNLVEVNLEDYEQKDSF